MSIHSAYPGDPIAATLDVGTGTRNLIHALNNQHKTTWDIITLGPYSVSSTIGLITSVLINSGGTGYTGATTVTGTGGGAITQATFTPTISAGIIQSVTINTPGSGYSSFPTLVVADTGGGVNASLAVNMVWNLRLLSYSNIANATGIDLWVGCTMPNSLLTYRLALADENANPMGASIQTNVATDLSYNSANSLYFQNDMPTFWNLSSASQFAIWITNISQGVWSFFARPN